MWYKLKGYGGNYLINEKSQILSIKRKGNPINRILKTFIDKDGYVIVSLHKNNKSSQKRVHRLMAETFLNKTDFKSMPWENRKTINLNDLVINHKDENSKNNQINNLEWCTVTYNNNYGTRLTKQACSKSKQIDKFTLNNEYVCSYNSIKEICDLYGYNKSCISECCNGKRNKAYGYIWKFKERVQYGKI